MAVPYEIELKLAISDRKELAKLQEALNENAAFEFQERVAMKAMYFDTPELALTKRKLAYRIRRENERLLATLKGGGSAAGGLHKRLELNVGVSSEMPDLRIFAATEGAQLLDGLQLDGALHEIVRTEFMRNVYLWRSDAGIIEVALDDGWIYGGAKSSAILELELELKNGAESELHRLAAYFQAHFILYAADKSKFLRGMELRTE